MAARLTRGAEADAGIGKELEEAGSRALAVTPTAKKNYAERFSRALASRVAQELRANFPGVLPDTDGRGQESRARSSKGYKRLDVNYSTVELGLGLGVSIKTINFRDGATKRYTKNYTRADAELRAEAADYHERQPYAVMVALIFLPVDSCDDGEKRSNAPSSFGQAVQIFRFRGGREKPTDPPLLFERVFIGLYHHEADEHGNVRFFDVRHAPPKRGRPSRSLSMSEVVREIVKTYDARNRPAFIWDDGQSDPVSLPASVPDDEEE
jgi:hypothetical protein